MLRIRKEPMALGQADGGAEMGAPPPDRNQFVQKETAASHLREKRYTDAAAAFGSLVDDQTRDTGLLMDYARALTGTGERNGVTQAIGLWQRALTEAGQKGKHMPDRNREEKVAILLGMAESYGRIEAYDEALTCYGYVLEGDPENPEVRFLRDMQEGDTRIPSELLELADRDPNPERARLLREQAAVAQRYHPPTPDR